MKKITRRNFLKGTVAVAGTLAAQHVFALDLLKPVLDPLGAYPYRGWETLYTDQWSYDSFGRSTHGINCTGSCTWKAFVKNGILFKEEQFADYPDINNPNEPGYDPTKPALPTTNPRGCQKGAHYKEYIYGPQRIKYPLIRVGARGAGQWRKATWDEALAYIATAVNTAITANGPDTVTFYSAIPAKHHLTLAGGFRLANLIGGVACSFYDWYCDLPPGEPLTWGVQTDACEAADWFNSKYLILWGSNLLETRIPDAQFMTAARMNGAKVVAIFPEYNPVSIHADTFVAVNPGTDTALALAMANVIVNSGLYDAAYVKQFTDMPFLVIDDPASPANGKFLRESDMVAGGSTDNFYVWNLGSRPRGPALVPGTLGSVSKTLDLGAINPALEIIETVRLADGTRVNVTTVFALLKASLADHSPAAAAAITGVEANLITADCHGVRHHQTGPHHRGRGHQSLLSQRPDQPGPDSARGADRQCRQAGRRIRSLRGAGKTLGRARLLPAFLPPGPSQAALPEHHPVDLRACRVTSDVDSLWPRPIDSTYRKASPTAGCRCGPRIP